MTSDPLVTAICITRNRRAWLPKSIQAFLSQTYQNRRMLIVADGEPVNDLVPADERITLTTLEKRPDCIGQKRNIACGMADGELIAVWDDDDYYAPERLAVQVADMKRRGGAVHGFHTIKFTDGMTWWLYRGVPTTAVGTSLCFLREWWEENRFVFRNVGEDNHFAVVAHNAGQLRTMSGTGLKPQAAIEPDDLIVAYDHAWNTARRGRFDHSTWQRLER